MKTTHVKSFTINEHNYYESNFCYPMRDDSFSSNHELYYYSVEHKQMISTNRNLFVKHYCMLNTPKI